MGAVMLTYVRLRLMFYMIFCIKEPSLYNADSTIYSIKGEVYTDVQNETYIYPFLWQFRKNLVFPQRKHGLNFFLLLLSGDIETIYQMGLPTISILYILQYHQTSN